VVVAHGGTEPGVAQPIGSGNVSMDIQTIPEAGGQEWLVYNFVSVGPSLAGNINRVWCKHLEAQRDFHRSLDTLRGYVRRVDLKEHAGAAFL
jgi:hypothetical protein